MGGDLEAKPRGLFLRRTCRGHRDIYRMESDTSAAEVTCVLCFLPIF